MHTFAHVSRKSDAALHKSAASAPQMRVISSVGLERCLDRAEVTGSNPVLPTIKFLARGVAQPGSVHVWGACGRKFKSCHPDKRQSQLSDYQIVGFLFFIFVAFNVAFVNVFGLF